jgi:mannose-1-phosphate guanylyltransferase/phosphomannomutase
MGVGGDVRAMVLCAGFGKRMGSLTKDMPKPMLKLNGKPLLGYVISNIARNGFNEIAINLHYMPEIIRTYLDNHLSSNIEFSYSYEKKPMGTAGGIKKMENYLREKGDFLVHYGDIITDQDFSPMLQFHQKKKALITLLLHERNQSNSIVIMNEYGCITGFLERPSDEERLGIKSLWVNSGVYICSPELFEYIPKDSMYDIPRDVIPRLIPSASGRVYGFPLTGYRCAVDSPKRLMEAENAMKEGFCKDYYSI